MVNVITFGCRLNAYESEVMREHAQQAGLGENVVIINSCAVTKEAERQARQEARKAKRRNPNAKVIVTGCAAQINPESFAAIDEVDIVLGNNEKMQANSWQQQPTESKIIVNDIMQVREMASHMVKSFSAQTRAFVQVQNGCDHRCTFCIIPYGRGNSRSVPVGEVVRQVQKLVEEGCKEVVFTGVDISSYGGDLPANPTLGELVRRTLKLVPELPRLRISSIDAIEIDDVLMDVIASEERFMPHLHISLQSGDDMILKRMKRRHLRKDALEFCNRIRRLRPDIVFGADIIAGFPTETEEMFSNSLSMIDEAGLTYLHVFPYSEREGTPAAKMPQIDTAIRKERAAILRKAGERMLDKFLASKVGTISRLLVEQNARGHDEHFAPIVLIDEESGEELLDTGSGELIKVKIIEHDRSNQQLKAVRVA